MNPVEDETQRSRPDGLSHLLGQFWDRKMAIVGVKDDHVIIKFQLNSREDKKGTEYIF